MTNDNREHRHLTDLLRAAYRGAVKAPTTMLKIAWMRRILKCEAEIARLGRDNSK